MNETLPSDPGPLLQVEDLKVHFFSSQGTARAVDGVSFHLNEGEVLGIVGESGCGKSVTALAILRLIPDPPGKIAGGRVLFQGQDLLGYPEHRMRKVRGRQIAMIFQEPMTSLNPVFSIGGQLSEMFHFQMGLGKKEAWARSVEMLRLVHIPAPEKRVHEYPHELSGGMRQRVMIAMALACRPPLVIADEPTTALDVTIQAQILELMTELQEKLGLAVILISHDLGIVAHRAQRILVMYAGRIVEQGDVFSIFEDPRHPYTRGLLKAVPRIAAHPDAAPRRLYEIQGVVPSLYQLPEGCSFHPRCDRRDERCLAAAPPEVEVGPNHLVRCHLPA
ncbi:MAG: ABC transporter ATP-binding protein [Thermodesulfobacteriota bacterium]